MKKCLFILLFASGLLALIPTDSEAVTVVVSGSENGYYLHRHHHEQYYHHGYYHQRNVLSPRVLKTSGDRLKGAGDLSTAFTEREDCVHRSRQEIVADVHRSFLKAVPPLWHAAREVINPATISRSARAISLRIRTRNDSRTNGGCKSFFEQAIEPAIGKASPFLMGRQ
jgi:hypothetical protein